MSMEAGKILRHYLVDTLSFLYMITCAESVLSWSRFPPAHAAPWNDIPAEHVGRNGVKKTFLRGKRLSLRNTAIRADPGPTEPLCPAVTSALRPENSDAAHQEKPHQR